MQQDRESTRICEVGDMTSSKGDIAEMMGDYLHDDGLDDAGDDMAQKKNLKPHAQAHLLSTTENCKVTFCFCYQPFTYSWVWLLTFLLIFSQDSNLTTTTNVCP